MLLPARCPALAARLPADQRGILRRARSTPNPDRAQTSALLPERAKMQLSLKLFGELHRVSPGRFRAVAEVGREQNSVKRDHDRHQHRGFQTNSAHDNY